MGQEFVIRILLKYLKKDGLKMQNDPLYFVLYMQHCESETKKTLDVILIETNLKNRPFMQESISIKMSTKDKQALIEKAHSLRLPLSTYIRLQVFKALREER